MKMSTRFVFAAAVLAAAHIASAGDITGKITLKGTPPPERVIPMDKSCGDLWQGKPQPTTRVYTVGEGGGLADVVVYVKDASGASVPVPAEPAVLDQHGCEYLPYIIGIRAKQQLLVKNSDPVMHNVHTVPSASSGNKELNKAQMAKQKPLEFAFDNPEMFLTFKCDVHRWMFAYVSVFDHPYFTVSQKDGTFKIANVPPGKYTVEAAHRRAGKQSMEVTVGADAAKADFTLEVPAAAK